MPLHALSKERCRELRQQLKKENCKRAIPVRNIKSAEVRYRKRLQALARTYIRRLDKKLIKKLYQLEPNYVRDADYSAELTSVFENYRKSLTRLTRTANGIASGFIKSVDGKHKSRFYKSIQSTVGVDLGKIVKEEGIEDFLKAANRENVNLIKTIPGEHLDKVEKMVWRNVVEGSDATSMIDQLRKINGSTVKRARLIARDQTSKLTNNLTEKRQTNLGIKRYVWRTAGDGPRVRPTHRENEGKIFEWDKPSKITGHPGHDVQCRCIAQAIINVDELLGS